MIYNQFLFLTKKIVKILKNKSINTDSPHSLIVDTTMLCNNSCYFCWRRQKPDALKEVNKKYLDSPHMEFSTFKKIVDQACRIKTMRWLSLCGPMGEPMMHPEIEKFFAYAHSKNKFKTIVINTNGLAIDKHDIPTLLSSITEFSISVDSIDPETYGKIHGSAEFLPKVIENIKKCIDYKKKNGALAKIIVRFTENELNIGQYPEFEKFFKELGVDDINYTKVHSFAGVKKELASQVTASNCCQPRKVINFNFKGDLTTCCINWQMSPTFGNINKSSLKKLWMNKSMKQWLNNRLNTEPCKYCGGLGNHVQKRNLKDKKSI